MTAAGLVVSAVAFRLSEVARAVGARAVVRPWDAVCAAGENCEPTLATVTCTATDCTEVLTPVIALPETFKLAATAVVLTTGAARLPPPVALTSDVTVKDVEAPVIRRTGRCHGTSWRRVATATTSQVGPWPLHRSSLSASAICAGVTPAGRSATTVDVLTMLTSTVSPDELAEVAACSTVVASVAASRETAAAGSMLIVDSVAYESGPWGGGEGGGGGAEGGGGGTEGGKGEGGGLSGCPRGTAGGGLGEGEGGADGIGGLDGGKGLQMSSWHASGSGIQMSSTHGGGAGGGGDGKGLQISSWQASGCGWQLSS